MAYESVRITVQSSKSKFYFAMQTCSVIGHAMKPGKQTYYPISFSTDLYFYPLSPFSLSAKNKPQDKFKFKNEDHKVYNGIESLRYGSIQT